MIGNNNKATVILAGVSLGFFVSYPFQHTFVGGLATGGFGSAMIGGLADWFAVSALFRRPLGIPFRTNIIPRNRERIFKALSEMVENEILMKENIKARLANYQLSGMLLHFMVEKRGKSYLKKILYRFFQDMLTQIRPDELVAIINNIIQHNRRTTKILPPSIEVLEWLITNSYHEKIITIIIEQLTLVANHEQMQPILADLFRDVWEKYERGMNRRKFFNKLVNLSPTQVAQGAQQALVTLLSEMTNLDHPLRTQINLWLTQFIIKLKTDEIMQDNVEKWLQEKMISQINVGSYMVQGISAFDNHEPLDTKQIIRWLSPITDQLDQFVSDFATNGEKCAQLDVYLKNVLSDLIDTHHHKIGVMVKDSLNEFTNERLVSFIESKVGNDLQMIRINGSVVGGLMGMVIYLLTFWVK